MATFGPAPGAWPLMTESCHFAAIAAAHKKTRKKVFL
jgi:hypothetical protein